MKKKKMKSYTVVCLTRAYMLGGYNYYTVNTDSQGIWIRTPFTNRYENLELYQVQIVGDLLYFSLLLKLLFITKKIV